MNWFLIAAILLTFQSKADAGKGVLLVSLIGERQVAVIDPITQDVLQNCQGSWSKNQLWKRSNDEGLNHKKPGHKEAN